jgi:septum formation topological specificity factor MinE
MPQIEKVFDKKTKKLDDLLDDLTEEILDVIYSYLATDTETKTQLRFLSRIRASCDILRHALFYIEHKETRFAIVTELLDTLQKAIATYPQEWPFMDISLKSLQKFKPEDLAKLRPHASIIVADKDHFFHRYDEAPDKKRLYVPVVHSQRSFTSSSETPSTHRTGESRLSTP